MGFLKAAHRWLGAVTAVFLLGFAVSGVALNHREAVSRLAVSRRLLPRDYHFANWNLAAVKSAVPIGPGDVLLFGNIGIWRADGAFSSVVPSHQGIKPGMDNRKTFRVLRTRAGSVYAATMSGLYRLTDSQWVPVPLPVPGLQVRGLAQHRDALYVLTRSHLLVGQDDPLAPGFRVRRLPAPVGDGPRVSLFRVLWLLHSGKILGLPGRILVDVAGIALACLCVSGLLWLAAPDVLRALRERMRSRRLLAGLNRVAIRWHRRAGIWAGLLLAGVTLTGMFLRPPLLLAVVRRSLGGRAAAALNRPNPWHDKLRDIQVDRLTGTLLISTSEGFHACPPDLTGPMRPMSAQPPVSVMGITVFEQPADGVFLVGSFSGLYRWVPSLGHVHDALTGAPATGRQMGPPFGRLPVSGYLRTGAGAEVVFTYTAGAMPLRPGNPFPPMPETVKRHAPLPLWNLALEVHTGRFYGFMLGRYAILVVPLVGLATLTLLASGLVLRFRQRRRRPWPRPPA